MASVNDIMAYENAEMDWDQMVAFFSDLITSGVINGLQGSYQRTARDLIIHGYLDSEGNVIENGRE